MIEVWEKPIPVKEMVERLSWEESGSVVFHFGVVKPEAEGQKTAGMRLSRAGDLEGELRKVEEELRRRWELKDVLIVRRLGELKIGDVILVVGVAATTRETAFAACEEAVRLLKMRRGLHKEELYCS